jgi:hypothetical protein
MFRRVLVAGILGFLVLAVFTFVINGIFGFTLHMKMNRVADEPAVHRALKTNVTAPGAYIVNPALTPDHDFPFNEPVFAVTYSGFGHESAGRMMIVESGSQLVAALIMAALLALASAAVLSTFVRRFGFVLLVGVLIALTGDLSRYGIGGYPLGTAVSIALVQVAGWGLAGLVMAWAMRTKVSQ